MEPISYSPAAHRLGALFRLLPKMIANPLFGSSRLLCLAGAQLSNRGRLRLTFLGNLSAALIAGLLLAASSHAQSYPNRPIRLIVPFAVGGSTDLAARVVGDRLGRALGQTVIVENIPGGGTMVGTTKVIREKPDGYTLLFASNSLASNPTLRNDLPYDTVKDFQAVGMVARQPFVFAIHPSVPAATVEEFIAYAKAHPGKVNFGASGVGTGNHLVQELFSILTGTELRLIPYKGDGPMVIDLIAGRIQMTITTVSSVLPYIESGALKALGVGDAEPLAQLPNVPPISKAGVPAFVATAWNAIFVRSGTPKEIVLRLNQALKETLDDPAVGVALSKSGTLAGYKSPEEMESYLQSEIERWGDVIRSRNIHLQ